MRSARSSPATSGNPPRSQYSSNALRTSRRRRVAKGPSASRPLKSRNSRKEKGKISHDSARPRIWVAISRDSIRADEPVMYTSHFSVRIRRSTNGSQPGTTWISSKKQ